MRKAPTSTGLWPLRPSARLSADDPIVVMGLMSAGTPVGYTRDPDLWLPEWSQKNMPVVVASSVKSSQTWYDGTTQGKNPTHKENNMEDQNIATDTLSADTATDIVDDRDPSAMAPRKRTADEPKAKRAKASKAPKEPAASWEPSEDALRAVEIMRAIAATGDKKTLAYFVAEAIECRAEGKRVRELAAGE